MLINLAKENPMSKDQERENDKIIELAKARKQMLTLKAQKDKKNPPGYGSLNGNKSHKNHQTGRRSFWEYVQFVFFLAMAAYMMQLCSGGI